MAAAYAALETKLGGQTPPATETPATPPKTETPPQTPPANVDMAKLSEEFEANGKLSDATYDALKAKGFDKGVVSNYIAGQQARAEQIRTDVFKTVGGEDKYTEMVTWAKGALTPAEANAYDEAVNSGDMAKINLAVSGLFGKYTNANGREPSLVGGTRGASGPAPFESVAQLTAAMRDSRYAKDPAYRKEVENRLAASSIL